MVALKHIMQFRESFGAPERSENYLIAALEKVADLPIRRLPPHESLGLRVLRTVLETGEAEFLSILRPSRKIMGLRTHDKRDGGRHAIARTFAPIHDTVHLDAFPEPRVYVFRGFTDLRLMPARCDGPDLLGSMSRYPFTSKGFTVDLQCENGVSIVNISAYEGTFGEFRIPDSTRSHITVLNALPDNVIHVKGNGFVEAVLNLVDESVTEPAKFNVKWLAARRGLKQAPLDASSYNNLNLGLTANLYNASGRIDCTYTGCAINAFGASTLETYGAPHVYSESGQTAFGGRDVKLRRQPTGEQELNHRTYFKKEHDSWPGELDLS